MAICWSLKVLRNQNKFLAFNSYILERFLLRKIKPRSSTWLHEILFKTLEEMILYMYVVCKCCFLKFSITFYYKAGIMEYERSLNAEVITTVS